MKNISADIVREDREGLRRAEQTYEKLTKEGYTMESFEVWKEEDIKRYNARLGEIREKAREVITDTVKSHLSRIFYKKND